MPAGFGERRVAVLDIGEDSMQDIAYFAAIDAEMDSGGREALLDFLESYDLGAVRPACNPKDRRAARPEDRVAPGREGLVAPRAGQRPTAAGVARGAAVRRGGWRADVSPT